MFIRFARDGAIAGGALSVFFSASIAFQGDLSLGMLILVIARFGFLGAIAGGVVGVVVACITLAGNKLDSLWFDRQHTKSPDTPNAGEKNAAEEPFAVRLQRALLPQKAGPGENQFLVTVLQFVTIVVSFALAFASAYCVAQAISPERTATQFERLMGVPASIAYWTDFPIRGLSSLGAAMAVWYPTFRALTWFCRRSASLGTFVVWAAAAWTTAIVLWLLA